MYALNWHFWCFWSFWNFWVVFASLSQTRDLFLDLRLLWWFSKIDLFLFWMEFERYLMLFMMCSLGNYIELAKSNYYNAPVLQYGNQWIMHYRWLLICFISLDHRRILGEAASNECLGSLPRGFLVRMFGGLPGDLMGVICK